MKKFHFRAISLILILGIILASNVSALSVNLEQDKSDIPDIVKATLEYLNVTPNNDAVEIEGQVNAGKLNIPIKCKAEIYQVTSDSLQNGKYVANVLSSQKHKIINISFGTPCSSSLISNDIDLVNADNITRIAIYDESQNIIYSVEQHSDVLRLEIIGSVAKTITPSDDLYSDIMQNEHWLNRIIRQQIAETTKCDYVDVNEFENIHKKSSEALVSKQVDPEIARQQKGEYETLKSNNQLHAHDDGLISQNSSIAATSSPTVDSSIKACVNYVGSDKFMTNTHTVFQRNPTSYDPTGYYMEITAVWPHSMDGCSCGTKVVRSSIIGYQALNMAPKDDPNNSSFAYIRLDIIWAYDILYYPCQNRICKLDDVSAYRIRDMKLAMNTDEDSTDYFYRMIANSKTRNGIGVVSNPAVNLALMVIPGGKYVNLGINVWNNLYKITSNVTANGANGSADKSWSTVDSTHQQQMLALTGDTGYNRVANVDCIQQLDNKWLEKPGHYIYMDTYVKSTGQVKNKWMQYSYKFSICTQNTVGYFYTIKTVNDYYYRSYCR